MVEDDIPLAPHVAVVNAVDVFPLDDDWITKLAMRIDGDLSEGRRRSFW